MSGKILVTGGAGYIGTHTIVELHDAGYEVAIIDNFINSDRSVLEQLHKLIGYRPEVFVANLLDKEALEEVFSRNNFIGVIHLAALKAVGASTKRPWDYYKNNIISTINLCEVMAAHDVKHLVFSSSATVYGESNNMPVNEEGDLAPSNPYGRTKLFMEEMLKDLYQSDREWKISLLRYFNPVGAHESGLIGERPRGMPNNLMPLITDVATGKLARLKVFGADYNTIDGTGVRDYIHVSDLARGHVLAYERQLVPGVQTYNMGTGKGYSVLEVVKAFEKVTNKKIPYEIVDRRPGDIAICYADVSKSNTKLDWRAERDLFDMCRDAWNWQMKGVSEWS